MTGTRAINQKIYCLCGCGQILPPFKRKDRPVKFINGHQGRGKYNTNYKNGSKQVNKYNKILKHDHPHGDIHGYVMQHRLIYEHYLKILFDEDVFIPRKYDVHHINGIKNDNRLINLQMVTRKEHRLIHVSESSGIRNCSECGSKDTWFKSSGRPLWRSDKKCGWLCSICYGRKYWKEKKLKDGQ